MGPNDVELVRVFTRQPAGATADVTFAVNQPFQIIVEAEAGATYMLGGALVNATYLVGVTVRDLTDGSIIQVPAPIDASGTIPATWTNVQARSFTFNVAAQPTKADHCLEVLAFLRVLPPATIIPDVSFVTSPLFIIHP